MNLIRLGSLLVGLVMLPGCSANEASQSGNNGGNGGVAGSNQGGGYHLHTGGKTGSNTGTGIPDLDSGCAHDKANAQLTQVNILILLDKSGTMGDQKNAAGDYDWQNCESRWNPVTDTLKAFFSDPNSSRLFASLSLLPADGDEYGMCTASNYSTGVASLKIPLTALDQAGRDKFTQRLCACGGSNTPGGSCIIPGGGTPSRVALQGTIEYAASVQKSYPKSKTVIVFLTDGEPGFGYTVSGVTKHLYSCDDLPRQGCSAGDCGCVDDSNTCRSAEYEIETVREVIAGAAADSVSIYVAGVGAISETTLNAWAEASGNPAINLLRLDGTQAAAALRASLDDIRKSELQCAFEVPQPDNGVVDKDATNVVYISGSGDSKWLYRTKDGTFNTCSATELSWYFDNPTAPTQIELCPNTCTELQKDPKGALQVVYGCSPLVPLT